MKTENQSSSQDKKNTKGSKQGGTSKKKGGTTAEPRSSAVDNVKAKTGRGLANEGTVVSYDQER